MESDGPCGLTRHRYFQTVYCLPFLTQSFFFITKTHSSKSILTPFRWTPVWIMLCCCCLLRWMLVWAMLSCRQLLSRTYVYRRAFWVISLLKIKKSYKNWWDSETTSNLWSSATNRVLVAQSVWKWWAKQECYFKWKWLKNHILFLVAFGTCTSVCFF